MSSLVITPRIYSRIETYIAKAKEDPRLNILSIREIHIDDDIAAAVVDLLQDHSGQWDRISIGQLMGNVDVVLTLHSTMYLVSQKMQSIIVYSHLSSNS